MTCNSEGFLFGGWGSQMSRSTDNGATWSNINLPLVTYIADITTGPRGIIDSAAVLAATGNVNGTTGQGVFKSTDNGTTFAPFNNGLTNLNVTAVSASSDPGSCHAITVGTKGDGEFAFNQTTNQWEPSGADGATIVSIKDSPSFSASNQAHLAVAAAFLFARDNTTCQLGNVLHFLPNDMACIIALGTLPQSYARANGQGESAVLVGTNGGGILRVTGITTSVNTEANLIPSAARLEQNYPNPFNPQTTIKYRISHPGYVTLKVFDVLGREIATLVNQKLQPGTYESKFDAKGLPSGMYFYRMRADGFVQTRKFMLLR
jgi:Secretion system C-terminal sorting domain